MSATQSTQYNAVQGPYDELRKGSISIIERVNVRSIVLPFIKDANVLDLACGSGSYSHAFIKWGASGVVGVDISSAMLETANALGHKYGTSNKIEFIEADCSKPVMYKGGPFDLVFGGWLLNYASSGKEMVDFWRNIQLNLKSGGHFVGVTPPPTDDPAGHVDAEQRARPLPTASSGMYTTLNHIVDEGARIHRHADTPAGDLDFDTYHLRKDVWIAAARVAGFDGEIEWEGTRVPSDFMEGPEKYGEQSNGGAANHELSTYATVPHYGTIHVRK
jgi:SAM-dependent methyltransferase